MYPNNNNNNNNNSNSKKKEKKKEKINLDGQRMDRESGVREERENIFIFFFSSLLFKIYGN